MSGTIKRITSDKKTRSAKLKEKYLRKNVKMQLIDTIKDKKQYIKPIAHDCCEERV